MVNNNNNKKDGLRLNCDGCVDYSTLTLKSSLGKILFSVPS